MIKIHCKNCLSEISAKESAIGKTLPCPKCQQPVSIEQKSMPLDDPVMVDSGYISSVPSFKPRMFLGAISGQIILLFGGVFCAAFVNLATGLLMIGLALIADPLVSCAKSLEKIASSSK